MLITIKVTTKNAVEEVIKMPDNPLGINYRVKVNCPPQKNMANFRVVDLLADYFKKGKSGIKILKGLKSNIKTIQIDE